METYLHVGGLVAAGFDVSGRFLLTVSSAGRGVFAVDTWTRVARDPADHYPEDGRAIGIGPIEGQVIEVAEIDDESRLDILCPDGRSRLTYRSGTITINDRPWRTGG